ncbi:hypothetical protein JCM3765_005754 [Sporobolomyces pararoseus]
MSSSGSSSLSPPSLRYSPFSVLPVELVHLISRFTATLETHSYNYISRQSTLASLCLTSKLFLQIAKPLLFETVYLTSRTAVDSWREVRQTEGITTQTVIIEGSELRLDRLDFSRMAQNYPKISKLTLMYAAVDLRLVSMFNIDVVAIDQAYEDLVPLGTEDLKILEEKTIFDIWRSGHTLLGQLMEEYSDSQCFKFCRMNAVEDPSNEMEDLEIITKVLNSPSRPTHLELFYLFTSDLVESISLKAAIDELRTVCQKFGIELIWREREGTLDPDEYTRKDLARRLKGVI